MKRPKEKDYFEYRGKTLIMDHGRAENFMDAQDEYIDFIEAQTKSLKSDSLPSVIESFQNFLIMDGQIEIDPHDAKRNVEIFINSL
jgi:hypothetical protein